MSATHNANEAQRPASAICPTRLLALAAMILLALSLALTAMAPNAYADIKPADEVAASDESTSAEPADAEAADQEEGESIEDEETPLSSDLGGGEPAASDVNVAAIAVVGIIAVGSFFFVLMRKLNGNINDMNKMFH